MRPGRGRGRSPETHRENRLAGETIIHDATIVTADDAGTIHHDAALVFAGGRIVAIGPSGEFVPHSIG